MKLSVIIPCFNEIATIEQVACRVRGMTLPIETQIIIVDDCSRDGTREYLMSLKDATDIKICLHEKNSGKGSALRTGFAKADGDILLIQDADPEYDSSE
jgi:glycosyltransferase involved in cell wall biosynthesis